MLRIAFITNNFTPYSGGVVSSILSYTNELRVHGHEVTIISLDFLGDQHDDEPHIIRLNCPVQFWVHGKPMAVPWRTHDQLETIISRLKVDIIHVHHPFLLGFAGSAIGKKFKIPVVFTYHTLYEHYLHYVPFVPYAISKPVMQHRVLSFAQSVDHIIAPSTYVKKYLTAQRITTPVEVLPSPLRSIFFDEMQTKKTGARFRLLTVSRFEQEKNLTFLLDVFAQLDQSQFCFDLVGYGTQLEGLKSYAYQKLGLSCDDVRFVVRPSQEELINHYRNADLFLFSSHSETQGLVLAESMACGTPVVSLHGPGQRDLIENAKNGYLVRNQKEMIEIVLMLQKHCDVLEKLSRGACTTARLYHPSYLTQKLCMLYHKNLSR